MGVTIHFQGKLRSAGHMPKLQEALLPWAKRWKTELVDVDIPEADIIRVRNGKVEESIGRLRGCHVFPHKDSEPLRFWFTDDLYMESFCKTQFAPVDTHIEVVELLRVVKPLFTGFKVIDEGGYWETSDREELARRIGFLNSAIDRIASMFPPAPEEVMRRFGGTPKSGEN